MVQLEATVVLDEIDDRIKTSYRAKLRDAWSDHVHLSTIFVP